MTVSFRILFFLCICAVARGFGELPPDADGARYFAEKIQPILTDNCFKCHSHSAEKSKGGLVVDSREALLAGGDTAPAVVPGDPGRAF